MIEYDEKEEQLKMKNLYFTIEIILDLCLTKVEKKVLIEFVQVINYNRV